MYTLYVCVFVCVFGGVPAPPLYEHDPGYRASIVRRGMGCMPARGASGAAEKNGAATHQPSGVTECTGGGGGASLFSHTHSYLSPSLLVRSPRKVFELLFTCYLSFFFFFSPMIFWVPLASSPGQSMAFSPVSHMSFVLSVNRG